MSLSEEHARVLVSNWNLVLENNSGYGIEFTLLSGSDSLQRILDFLKRGFLYGNVDRRIWCVKIIRGQELLEVAKPEDLNDQVIKRKWPGCYNHNASHTAPFIPREYNWVGEKQVYTRENDVKNMSSILFGNDEELESILSQVFTQKD